MNSNFMSAGTCGSAQKNDKGNEKKMVKTFLASQPYLGKRMAPRLLLAHYVVELNFLNQSLEDQSGKTSLK